MVSVIQGVFNKNDQFISAAPAASSTKESFILTWVFDRETGKSDFTQRPSKIIDISHLTPADGDNTILIIDVFNPNGTEQKIIRTTDTAQELDKAFLNAAPHISEFSKKDIPAITQPNFVQTVTERIRSYAQTKHLPDFTTFGRF